MNVYDFDNTIYDGESAVDFYLFLLRKKPALARVLPKLLWLMAKYRMCRITRSELTENIEKYAAKFLDSSDNIGAAVAEFWDKNEHKIKPFYLKNRRPDDVILSAGFEFQLGEICRRLGIKTVIGSQFDFENGKIKRLCFRESKLKSFREYFPDGVIDEFYTDSMNDSVMFKISRRVFIVKGNKIKEMIK